MKKLISLALCAVTVIVINAGIKWTEVEPGVWKGIVGSPEDYSLLSAAGCQPASEGFSRLPSVALPAFADSIVGTVSDGKTSLRIPLTKKEQLYGFGLNFQTVHQRGKILNLHVDHYGGKDTGRTHAPVPFYVSSAGYGIFINSARYMTVYAGSGARKDSPDAPVAKDRNTDKSWSARPYSDAVSVMIPAPGVEIYLIAGPTPMDVVRRYNLLCGGGTLPPRWGLGFTQRTQKLYDADMVEKEADEFERMGYPLDFIGLEPGWQSKAYPCSFEWDASRFPDPKGFVGRM
ncbi:MAG: glycoside hydrolase family 31 protein, partial [Duncaniella sp.]|nr:glycoside hydrolase family 31 protein [Duncaniella sp.]